jgi:hypothetical protein
MTPGMKWGIFAIFVMVFAGFFAKLHFLSVFSEMSIYWIDHFFQIPENQVVIESETIWNSLQFSYLLVPIETPSRILSLIVALVVSFIMFLLLQILRLTKASHALPTVILFNLLLSAIFCFSLLFLIMPGYFSQDYTSLSKMFSMVSHLILLGMPLLFCFLTAPVPVGFFTRLAYTVLFEVAIVLLFFIKYALFIVLCTYGTYLVIPCIVLLILSLWDVLYLNSIYSVMLSRASVKINKRKKVWQKT